MRQSWWWPFRARAYRRYIAKARIRHAAIRWYLSLTYAESTVHRAVIRQQIEQWLALDRRHRSAWNKFVAFDGVVDETFGFIRSRRLRRLGRGESAWREDPYVAARAIAADMERARE